MLHGLRLIITDTQRFIIDCTQGGYDLSVDSNDPARHAWSCIVFVKTRMSAFTVTTLLQALSLPALSWMRTAMLLGAGSDIKALDITPEVCKDG